MDVRGGSDTADHVDIMGNIELLKDVMSVVSGNGLEERLITNIAEISKIIRKNIQNKQ